MNLRFVAGGMTIGLVCAIAIVLFAPRTESLFTGYAHYERGIEVLRKHPGARQEFMEMCVPESEAELTDSHLEKTPYSSRAEMAKDLCRRYFDVVADGKLTLSEINRSASGTLPFSVIEEAERREPRRPRNQ